MVQLDLGLLDVIVDGRDKGVFGKEKRSVKSEKRV